MMQIKKKSSVFRIFIATYKYMNIYTKTFHNHYCGPHGPLIFMIIVFLDF